MIITYSGRYFDYNNIQPDSIHITDIAHSLARQSRYLAHTTRTYTVGEHTLRGLLIARHVGMSLRQQLYWLIHDFTEAYVGDCPSPLKRLLPGFVHIEEQVAKAILEYAGLPPMNAEEEILVHMVDRTMLVLEMRDLTHHDPTEYMDSVFYEVLNNADFGMDRYVYDAPYMTYAIRDNFQALLKAVKEDV